VEAVAFHCVKVCAFLMVEEDFHRVVNGARGVCVFQEVLGKF